MHNIGYLTFNEDVSRERVMLDITRTAERDGDGYSSRMTWHDNLPPFETYEEARQWIEDHDKGWYDDHAVRFKDYSKAKKTKKMEEYENKIEELRKAEREYREDHSVHNLQAKFIGCPKCNSKINKEYVVWEKCPACRTDLRSKTTLDKLKWFADKKEEYTKRIEDEKRKQKTSCKIMWLVKYEYHS